MKKYKSKILVSLAILNSIVLGLIAFLTIFMYKNNIGTAENISRLIIPICLLFSILTKFFTQQKIALILSLIFDFILIIYLYNPTDYDSIMNFVYSLLDFQIHIMIIAYLYLIFFYYLAFKELKSP